MASSSAETSVTSTPQRRQRTQACGCATSMLKVYVQLDNEASVPCIMLDRMLHLIDDAYESCQAFADCPDCSSGDTFPLSVLSALVDRLARTIDSCCRSIVIPRNVRRSCAAYLDEYRLRASEPEQLAARLLRSRLRSLVDTILTPTRSRVTVLLDATPDDATVASARATLLACRHALDNTTESIEGLVALLEGLLLEEMGSWTIEKRPVVAGKI